MQLTQVNDIQIGCRFCLKIHKNQFYSHQNEKSPKMYRKAECVFPMET